MVSNQLKIWFLLGYFVLLMNFGPSMHHASIFGLHAAHRSTGQDSACKCCHNVSSEWNLSAELTGHQPVDSDIAFDQDDSTCAFCKFFDEYNVALVSVALTAAKAPVALLIIELPDAAATKFISQTARGPPASGLSN